MNGLVEFLKARLDEDEKVAQAAATGWLRVRPDDYEEQVARSGWRSLPRARSANTGMYPETLLHVAIHDPARVLADVEAKRRIIAMHDLGGREHFCATEDGPDVTFGGGDCTTLRLLALPYASHPTFKEGWRP